MTTRDHLRLSDTGFPYQLCREHYLQHHEDFGGRLDDLVQTTHMLVAQVLHGFDLGLHSWQVLLEVMKGRAFRMTVASDALSSVSEPQ